MYNFSKQEIYMYEKKLSIEYAYKLYKNKKLIFPETPYVSKEKKNQKLSFTVEAILLGIALPTICVSEQQGGEYLVLDAEERLLLLFQYLDIDNRLGYMELFPELNGLFADEVDERFPKVSTLIFGYSFGLQIIDYSTPKYLHLQVGKHLDKWSFSREQGILNSLYSGPFKDILKNLSFEVRKYRSLFSTISLNRQYAILRIVMYEMVQIDMFHHYNKQQIGLQLLLEKSINIMNSWDRYERNEWESKFIETILSVNKWVEIAEYRMWEGKGKELQIRNLSYLYLVAKFAEGRSNPLRHYLNRFTNDYKLAAIIKTNEVTFDTIHEHLELLSERLDRYDSEN